MKRRTELQFAIIGIGAFGKALAKKLSEEGAYVIAIDNNMEHIEQVKDYVSDAICFDGTDADLLEEHGITNVDVAIISIGEAFEPVVLIAMHLLNAGVAEVYGRAGSYTQEQILKQIGITDVIHPERQVAERMGVSLVRRGMSDVFDLGEGMAVFEVDAPESMVGYTLGELDIRKRYQLNLITIKRLSKEDQKIGLAERYRPIGVLDGTTEIKEGDRFLLVGNKDDVDKLLDTN
ncbi:TrkA family potassium uptake protein [Aliifodinibius salicampi]|uniref:TrkA family potassium uptake protein n=1 Tax=Fodinibius salicampi TaxID=1920655 RepID=A0ABT3Q0R2_9BACT|nr:TrkA family potassium uptake protein [Fodinibius salicampi]MCW9713675.1 TrkA family potassium uptake protein [Fodinibius salicampi]